jgi:hypothetical protein
MTQLPPYNPLDKLNLGRSVADALLMSPVNQLADTHTYTGAGVYVIYYTGDFPAYRAISQQNSGGKFSQPIYIGKAIPPGGRKGGITSDPILSFALRERLKQHANSIDQAININIADFSYRSLVVDDIWIPLGENMLIEKYRPIWNLVIDGFGNKDPGNRRSTQYRSSWDVLHPGRNFATKLALGTRTEPELFERIFKFLGGQDVPLLDPDDQID